MEKGRIGSITAGFLLAVWGVSWAQAPADRPMPIGRQLKRAEMMAELKRIEGPLALDDAETYKNAPPEIRPDLDAVYEEIIQVNPADPPIYWLRKSDDERPLFTTLPYSEIDLVRRLHRHARELWATPGVWGFGMAEDGFHIHVDPAIVSPILPAELEKIPVVIEKEPIPRLSDHATLWKRPVGAGLSVGRTHWQHPATIAFRGALGPFVVFDAPQVPQCCNIYHAAAGHVMKHLWEPFPPNDSPGAWPQVRQPYNANLTNLWYIMGWQLVSVQTNPNFINYVSVRPDLAIIAHNNPPQRDGDWPYHGYVPPCTAVDSNTAPARKVFYGLNSKVNGPNGAILPVGTNADVKIFGSESAHATIAHITEYNVGITLQEADIDGTGTP
ncbi:MAG TPA: hypothetical protein VGX03_21150, partial [Candidatus Binatia bacterium]|nr:hypothetical protein [Candidatus Binatia bacterium]